MNTKNLTFSLNAGDDCKSDQENERKKKTDNGCSKIMDSEKKMVKKSRRAEKKEAELARFYAKV